MNIKKGPIAHFTYVASLYTTDITTNEIISFDVPLKIKELRALNVIVDELKKMSNIYDEYFLKRYISQAEYQDNDVDSTLKPKKRKRGTDAPLITFT